MINVGLSNQGLSSSGCVNADVSRVVASLTIIEMNKDVFRHTILRLRKCSKRRERETSICWCWLELNAAGPTTGPRLPKWLLQPGYL